MAKLKKSMHLHSMVHAPCRDVCGEAIPVFVVVERRRQMVFLW
jgi:hypothetical protein